MSGAYTITPQPRAGQQGLAWIRWLDRYAQEHAAAVVQMTVRDFPPSVRQHITADEDGESSTTSNIQIVATLMARLGAAHGLRRVPLTLDDLVTMTQALVLDQALATLRADALIGDYHVEAPQVGRGSPLGTALQLWLDAVLRAPGVPLAPPCP